MGLIAPKTYRLTRRKDIARMFNGGKRAHDGLITLYVLPNDLSHSRCGVAVSKRHGGAVRRNRIKRLCREAFRLTRPQLPSGRDFMIVPRVGGDFTLDKLQASVRSLAARLIGRVGE